MKPRKTYQPRSTTLAIIVSLSLIALGGCTSTSSDVEMPSNNQDGADRMKPSPCACLQLDYNGDGFRWIEDGQA